MTSFIGHPGQPAHDSGHPRRFGNAVVGTSVFIFTEVMFFCGLVSAYLVLRSHTEWPPADQPRLPVMVTGINTVVLLASAVSVWGVPGALRSDRPDIAKQWLLTTILMGVTFLAIQGYEWTRLIGFGLTTNSSLYGAMFYIVIGAHAAHVVGGIAMLSLVRRKMTRGAYSASNLDGVVAMRLFWLFVVGVWPILYVMVYLW
ncbi:MAG: heme-copper oxidase subunit III [Planctomycetota bacterium]|jgi:heme/copper-type cytochrome/quinol oxidase subunit 3|nr:heme-copper oxidase subunit III [Planctomycetota bacterium]